MTDKQPITKNRLKLGFVAILIATVLLLATTAKHVDSDTFSMPEEQVNYTITRVNGVLWAKIDGTYPITYTGTETSIPMIYPTPPGTTNITVWLNEVELNWSNFTEVHHTAIGEWSTIFTVLDNFTDHFVLRIHYEHPVQLINGSDVVLYDLNIVDYLSASDNKSVAHFTINMETEYTNLKVNTVFAGDETLKPINFTVSSGNTTEVRIDEVSEFGKPLPGDLLVSFSDAKDESNFMWIVVSVFVVGLILACLVVCGLLRRRRKREAR